jgi:hypothetical protein
MRKWLTVIILLGANVGFGQFGISFHQSNLPFVGLNYEVKDMSRPKIGLQLKIVKDGQHYKQAGNN